MSLNQLAFALQQHQAGRISEAERLYRDILAEHPNDPDALHFLGVVAHQVGRNAEAVALIRKAVALRPQYAEAYVNLGTVLREQRQLPQSFAACRRGLELNPTLAQAHHSLGNSFFEARQFEDAIVSYRKAISLRPGYAEAYSNLGNALRECGQLDEALASFHQAISLKPDYPQAHSNLGNVLFDMGELNQAITAFHRAIALKNDYADAHYNLSLSLLTQGNYAQGWAEHEWRWRASNFPSPALESSRPQWDGAVRRDATIFLHSEQGLGDALQFARYLPMVAERCRKVILACPPTLIKLMQGIPGVLNCVDRSDPQPTFDFHCPLLSLPYVFGTSLKTIPAAVPYLHADPAEVERWRNRLVASAGLSLQDSPKIGLAWAGNLAHRSDRHRSLAPSLLAPLLEIGGIRWLSLQKDRRAEPLMLPKGLRLIDWTDELPDFAATAALVANLDLVISVDTAVAHLAGAMGKPVWLLLPFACDWRWLRNREDTPWYPTMRLIRQRVRGDWPGVIANVVKKLEDMYG